MDHSIEGGITFHGFRESTFLGDVGNYGEVEAVFADVGVGFGEVVGFFLGADGGYYAVTALKEDVEDVGGDEAGAAGEEDAAHVWC